MCWKNHAENLFGIKKKRLWHWESFMNQQQAGRISRCTFSGVWGSIKALEYTAVIFWPNEESNNVRLDFKKSQAKLSKHQCRNTQ